MKQLFIIDSTLEHISRRAGYALKLWHSSKILRHDSKAQPEKHTSNFYARPLLTLKWKCLKTCYTMPETP